MGFFEDLMGSINRERNTNDPLFGGLVPRREQPETVQRVSQQPREVTGRPTTPISRGNRIMPQGGMDVSSNVGNDKNFVNNPDNDIFNGRLKTYNPLANRNVVFDYDQDKINLGKEANRIDADKLNYAREKGNRDFSLDSREQSRKENKDSFDRNVEMDKRDIEHRKQALDEWKVRNPEGEIKADENGKLLIIDKRTGKSVDTGITADHFSKKDAEDLKFKHNIDLEKLRQQGRETIKDMGGVDKYITPTQQRAAEKDAANDLLNDHKYTWLEKTGIITRDEKDGTLTFNEPTDKMIKGLGGSVEQAKGTIEQFKKDLASKASERMNKTIGDKKPTGGKTVKMVTPTGESLDVPEDEVKEAESHGAKRK